MKTPQKFTPAEKAQVALSAFKGEKTIAQISSAYSVHKTQIFNWKKHLMENTLEIFKDNSRKEKREKMEHQQELDNLYKIIGQREIELDWLKKKLSIFDPQ